MSGPNARFALPDDERAPADRRAHEPELELPMPAPPIVPTVAKPESIAPGDAAREAGRPLNSPSMTDGTLGLLLLKQEIGKLIADLVATFVELDIGMDEKKRGIVISALTRIETLARRLRRHFEDKRGVK